jgi:hypothetical protein
MTCESASPVLDHVYPLRVTGMAYLAVVSTDESVSLLPVKRSIVNGSEPSWDLDYDAQMVIVPTDKRGITSMKWIKVRIIGSA